VALASRNHDLPLGGSGHTPGGKEPGDTAFIGTVGLVFTFAMESGESLRQLRAGNEPDLVCLLILTRLYLYFNCSHAPDTPRRDGVEYVVIGL
jgi:hypothetical protein